MLIKSETEDFIEHVVHRKNFENEQVKHFNGEFDPGSGRTLAACLIHASRAESYTFFEKCLA